MKVAQNTPWQINYGAFWHPMAKPQQETWIKFLNNNLRGGLRDGEREIDAAMGEICNTARRQDYPPHVTDVLRNIIQARVRISGNPNASDREAQIDDLRHRISSAITDGEDEEAWNIICLGEANLRCGNELETYAVEKHGFRRSVAVKKMMDEFKNRIGNIGGKMVCRP